MSELRDYNDLYDAHEAEQAAYEARLPVCPMCNQPIMDEYYYDIGDGPICPDCFNNEYRHFVDLYMENN